MTHHTATITWTNDTVPTSKEFGDIYYNKDNGLHESLHNFVEGNNLLNRWQNHPQKTDFTIAELGFGTGLNFLLTWHEFQKNAENDINLHFISVEKYPLSQQDITKALSPWQDNWPDKFDAFIKHYNPTDIMDINFSEDIRLTVYFEDVATALPHIPDQSVNAFYLDGFNPSSNKDMWSDNVFQQMARLSTDGTTFSTFTAAGFVKRGLQTAGFDVRKRQGYGKKRECLHGIFIGDTNK